MAAASSSDMLAPTCNPCDIDITKISLEKATPLLVTHLRVKGFCTLSPVVLPQLLDKALQEVTEMEKTGGFSAVNAMIAEGLLGPEGSSQIALMRSQDASGRGSTNSLAMIDNTIADLGSALSHKLGMELDMSKRTPPVVHKVGVPEDPTPPVKEQQVATWLDQFVRHRLMVLVILGPSSGTLELSLYGDQEAEVVEIQTGPGTIVILRPDLMSHKYFSPLDSYTLSSFVMADASRKDSPLGNASKIPVACELDAWATNRLKELKEQQTTDTPWDPSIPDSWRQAMNHRFHNGQMMAVRGAACKFPGSHTIDDWYWSSYQGPDFVLNVPAKRWDHEKIYEPSLVGWKDGKSYCRHIGYIEGIELFDCKMFQISPNEARTMDPHQRMILEVGYFALNSMGKRKKTLMNAQCGVFVGCGNLEWMFTPKESSAALVATSGALSIHAGRFSYTFGLKGPSMTNDSEGASGLSATYLAAECLQQKGKKVPEEFAVAISAHINLASTWWPSQCASRVLSPSGRVRTFDTSADGYVRSDGVCALGVKPLLEVIDGEEVIDEDQNLVGVIAGAAMNNNGKTTNLLVPHGPAEQEAISEAVRNANISRFDVEGVAVHGAASYLADAVEVSSLLRAHRSDKEAHGTLGLFAQKTSPGNMIEVSGIAALLMNMVSAQFGVMSPNLHLRTANPYMDAFDQPVCITTEVVEMKSTRSFLGTMARGLGGTNVYMVTWGQVDAEKVPFMVPDPMQPGPGISFWAGGGGELEASLKPTDHYAIVGSWGKWQNPEPMENEGDNTFSSIITLGENRWEAFQIYLDSSPDLVLHPGEPKALKGSEVLGPDPLHAAHGFYWMIDGREGAKPAKSLPNGHSKEHHHERLGPDHAFPGNRFRISLAIAGKWRTVSWEKLPPLPSSLPVPVPSGQYYLVADWNNWAFQEFGKDESVPDLCVIEVTLYRDGGEFQIARNADWNQVFYPSTPKCKAEHATTVMGPDDMGYGRNWFLDGIGGDVFRIEFKRSQDMSCISWKKVGAIGLNEEEKLVASAPKYCIIGSWDEYSCPYTMLYDGTFYKFYIELGSSGFEHFVIEKDGKADQVLHPNVREACPHNFHVIRGPSTNTDGRMWCIGKHPADWGRQGSRYEIRLHLTVAGAPKKVDWSRIELHDHQVIQEAALHGYFKAGM